MQTKVFYDISDWRQFEMSKNPSEKFLYKFKKPNLLQYISSEDLFYLVALHEGGVYAQLTRDIFLVPLTNTTYDLEHEISLAKINNVYTSAYELDNLVKTKYIFHDYRKYNTFDILTILNEMNANLTRVHVCVTINFPHLITNDCNLENNMLRYIKKDRGLHLAYANYRT